MSKIAGKDEGNENELVTLVDEQGNEHDFMVEDFFEYGERRYAVLVPLSGSAGEGEVDEDDEDDLEAYIFRVEQVEGEDVLVEVEDEDEWEQAASHWEVLKQDLEPDFDGDEGLN